MANGKGTYYFSHDYHARNDEKIEALRLEHSWEGYGIYWMLVERMYEAPSCSIRHDKVKQIAMASAVSAEKLKAVIQTCLNEELFVSDGERFWSESAKGRKYQFESLKELNSAAGKKGMAKRWNKPLPNAPPDKPENAAEIRAAQREKLALVKKVFDYFCEQAGRALSLTKERRRIIEKRVDQGRTWEEFVKVIDNFSDDDWEGRDEYLDITYCMGTIKGVDKFDFWLHKKPKGEGIMGGGSRG